LVSRSQIFELRPLGEEELLGLLRHALADTERGLGYLKSKWTNLLAPLARLADGDARKALNSLEIAALTLSLPRMESCISIADSRTEYSKEGSRL